MTTTPTIDLDAILALPPDKRLAIAEAIWDSLTEEVPLTAAQLTEIDRRVEKYLANPTNVVPWEVVDARAERRARGES